MTTGQIDTIAYMTYAGSIPSRNADAVCVMNMCSSLAAQGSSVELVIPKGQALGMQALQFQGTLWELYGLPENFSIRYFSNPFDRFNSALRKNGYAFLALCYALLSGKQLINARHIELSMMAARFGRPFVFEAHNFVKPAASKFFPRFIECLNKPGCRGAIVTTTQAGRDSFIDAGVPESRIAVLPNGVQVHRYEGLPSKDQLRKKLQLPASKTIACFSGNLYAGRGIENIIHCAKKFQDIYFLIIGGGPEDVGRYAHMAATGDIKNLHFTGYIPGTGIPPYLKAADILLMPNTAQSNVHSMAYTSPMKMFDYLAAGKPIIVSDFPVLREIFTHQHNAFLVPADSAAEFARGVEWVLENPVAAEKMAAQARSDSLQYSWEKRAATYLSFVKALLWKKN